MSVVVSVVVGEVMRKVISERGKEMPPTPTLPNTPTPPSASPPPSHPPPVQPLSTTSSLATTSSASAATIAAAAAGNSRSRRQAGRRYTGCSAPPVVLA